MSPEPELAAAEKPSPEGGAESPRPVLAGRRCVALDDGRYLIYYTFDEAPPGHDE